MKLNRSITTGIIAAGVLLLAGSNPLRATPNFTVAAFATGTQGQNNSQDGSFGQYNGNNLSVPYGSGTIAWDGVTFDAADGSTGSAHITANFSSADNTDLLVSMAPGYNNWFFAGASGSCPTGTVDFSQYHAVQFDILWDTNSTLTIDQFNTGNNWPSSYLIGGVGSNYMATNASYYTFGVNVDLFTGSGGGSVQLGTFQIPTNAATGWRTVTMPYSDTMAGISSGAGIWFQGAFGGGSGINGGPYKASFWIDNLVLVGNVTIAPPPTVGISPAAPGLNLFTASGPALNNRESLQTVKSNYTWVGASGPVSYSFTISSYPIPSADQVQNHIFLVPSPGTESAPDYNEPNVIYMDLESTANGAAWTFRYKTNQPNGNSMIYGSGALGSLQSSTGVGTWTVTFNGNTNVTMTGPGGVSTNFSIPDGTGATSALFASNVVVYYGSQANNAAGENDHTVTSEFTVTGLGAANFDDNFVTDAGVLNTNIWKVNAASAQCVRMVGPGNPYYVGWTLPASGFSLQAASSVGTNPIVIPTTSNPAFVAGNLNVQLISTNDLPPGRSAFFSMVKRTFSKLLVLLPGESNAPGTPSGKSGTPTTQNTSDLVNVTVVAVDSQFFPVGGVTDTIQLGSTDTQAVLPNSAAMANGTVTFSTFLFQTDGTWTISATDTTSTNIPVANSSSVVVAN